MKPSTPVESFIDFHANEILKKLPAAGFWGGIVEFVVFGLKQAWACLFGGLLLFLIIVTRYYYPFDQWLTRYDFLFFYALSVQLFMLISRLETLNEAKVILIFHVVGTVMEVFKTYAGSWSYPGEAIFHIGAVPLFSGFMYASIGSYIARITRVFDIRYTNYPPHWAALLLCVAIYVNFFSHHYIWDVRYILFAVIIGMFGNCQVHFRVFRFTHNMPMLVGLFLVSLFIWIAENIGTWSKAWLYPSQENGWAMVSPQKLGAWYLLMMISFVLVTLVHKPKSLDTD